MKKLGYIKISETDKGLTFETEGFSLAEIVGILTIMRDDKIIECLNTKYLTNEKHDEIQVKI